MKSVICCVLISLCVCGCATGRPESVTDIWSEAQQVLASHEDYEHEVMVETFPEYADEIGLRREWDQLVRCLDRSLFDHIVVNRPEGINADEGIGPFLLVGDADDMIVLSASDPSFAMLLAEKDALKARIRGVGGRMRQLSDLTMPADAQARVDKSYSRMKTKLQELEEKLPAAAQ